jgi:hypothetical protein
MGPRLPLTALCAILAVFMVAPAFAQDAYPPDEVPEVIERNGEDGEDDDDVDDGAIDAGVEDDEEADVRGVSLEQDEPLARTGATIGVLAAVGAAVLVLGGVMLKASRRRVETE